MVKIIVFVFLFLMAMYYIDIVGKLMKDEKNGIVRYKGLKLYIPFAYWFAPVRDKPKRKKKSNVKPNTKSQDEKKH